jgi:hypothetical protein
MMKLTKEEFLNWCQNVITDEPLYVFHTEEFNTALMEHDLKLAELQRQGMAARTRTVDYIKSKIGDGKS